MKILVDCESENFQCATTVKVADGSMFELDSIVYGLESINIYLAI